MPPKQRNYISEDSEEWNAVGWDYLRLSKSKINKKLAKNLTEKEQSIRQWKWAWDKYFFESFMKDHIWNLREEKDMKRMERWFDTINPKQGELEEKNLRLKDFQKQETEKISFMHIILLQCWVVPHKIVIKKTNY